MYDKLLFLKEVSMTNPSIFHLLTQEYSLELVTTKDDIESLKEIRRKTLLSAYQNLAEIEDEESFLYNKDDEQAFIYLLKHHSTQNYVGTIRIYFVNEKTPIQQIPLQMYGHVEGIDHLVSEHPVCEVSRLALASDLEPYPGLSALQLRTYLTMGLMSTVGTTMFLYHCHNIFSIMEPALYRILKRQGIYFEQIGPAVEYYGMRIPHMIKRETLIKGSNETLGEITLFYLRKLCHSPESFKKFIEKHPYLELSDLCLDNICHIFRIHDEKVTVPFLMEQTRCVDTI